MEPRVAERRARHRAGQARRRRRRAQCARRNRQWQQAQRWAWMGSSRRVRKMIGYDAGAHRLAENPRCRPSSHPRCTSHFDHFSGAPYTQAVPWAGQFTPADNAVPGEQRRKAGLLGHFSSTAPHLDQTHCTQQGPVPSAHLKMRRPGSGAGHAGVTSRAPPAAGLTHSPRPPTARPLPAPGSRARYRTRYRTRVAAHTEGIVSPLPAAVPSILRQFAKCVSLNLAQHLHARQQGHNMCKAQAISVLQL